MTNPPNSSVLQLVLFGSLLCSGCVTPPDAAPLWAEHCAECHGEDGRGDPRRFGLQPGVDLARSEIVQKRVGYRIYRVIRNGSAAMPAFDHKLEHEEIESLTAYVLALLDSKDGATAPETPGDPQ